MKPSTATSVFDDIFRKPSNNFHIFISMELGKLFFHKATGFISRSCFFVGFLLLALTFSLRGQGYINLGSGVWNQFEEQFSTCPYPFNLYYGCYLGDSKYDVFGEQRSFSGYGCEITVAAMLLNYWGIDTLWFEKIPISGEKSPVFIDPVTLNNIAAAANVFDGDNQIPIVSFLDEETWKVTRDYTRHTILNWQRLANLTKKIRHYNSGRFLRFRYNENFYCVNEENSGSLRCQEEKALFYLGSGIPLPIRVRSNTTNKWGGHANLLIGALPTGFGNEYWWYVSDPGNELFEQYKIPDFSWAKILFPIPNYIDIDFPITQQNQNSTRAQQRFVPPK